MTLLALLLLAQSPADALLRKHCVECHDSATKKGGLDLGAAPASWLRVYERVRDGEMPPRAKLPEAEKKAFLDALEAAERKQPRSTLRRMTRVEVENTLRDLFDLPGLEIKELLPDDGRTLEISSIHLAKYMEAADYVLERALARSPEAPKVHKIARKLFGSVPTWFNDAAVPIKGRKANPETVQALRKAREQDRPKLFEQEADTLGILTCPRPAFGPQLAFRAVESGWYRVKITLWSFHWKAAEVLPPKQMESVALSTRGRLLAYFDAPAEPKTSEKIVWLNAGDRIDFAAANLKPHFADPIKYEGPGVGLDGYEIEGPLHQAWPPVSHKRLFGELPIVPHVKEAGAAPRRHLLFPWEEGWQPMPERGKPVQTVASQNPAADAARLLRDFLPRAFRRSVSSTDVTRYAKIALDRLKAGACFEDAMRAAYKVALCSPDFLFLRDPDRLTYFLWGSAGKPQPVDEMLRDPRSERFVREFLDQWLDLREIDATSPDRQLYPEFRPDLRDAMLLETRAFFRELLDKDLPASTLVHSDFAMLNQRLAAHYGVPGVEGADLRRVELPRDSRRGGVLTQASVLKVTANGTTTSPVKRGAWVMDRLLGRPPSPPPPGIPGVDPDVRGTVTLREQLAKHRSDPKCAGCHAGFDPPGFALESFDVIGGWRTRYRGGNLPVDPTGVLATGEAFADIDEYKKLLLRRPEEVSRALARRLLAYATGAPAGIADRRELEKEITGDMGVRTIVNLVARRLK